MSKKYRRCPIENQSVIQADTQAHSPEIENKKSESEKTNYEETFMRFV